MPILWCVSPYTVEKDCNGNPKGFPALGVSLQSLYSSGICISNGPQQASGTCLGADVTWTKPDGKPFVLLLSKQHAVQEALFSLHH